MNCDELRSLVRDGLAVLGEVAKLTPAEWDDTIVAQVSRGVESTIIWGVVCRVLSNRMHLLSAAPGQVNDTPLTLEEERAIAAAFSDEGGKPEAFNPLLIITAIQAIIPIIKAIREWRQKFAAPPEPTTI